MKTLLLIQGAFYVITGLWPLLSLTTFEKVTGPKKDKWLVKTVGTLLAISGLVFLLGGVNPVPPKEVVFLACANCFALAAVDIIYVMKKIISPVYLLDAAVEILLLAAYFMAEIF